MNSIIAIAAIKVFVTVLPQVGMVQDIGGKYVEVNALISKAGCPETYAPSPKQLQKLSEADVFLKLGLPFEEAWLNKIKNSHLQTISMTKNIKLRTDNDPHVWLSLNNLGVMAENTASILSELRPDQKEYFQQNLKVFKQKVKSLDEQLKIKIKQNNSKDIFVIHPSYAYFADDYGLKQYAIEFEGKEPTAKQLANMIKTFKDLNAHIILVQPEFSIKAAKAIADATKATLVPISIYDKNPLKNMEELLNKWK
jgi:zinc transport system substrate-binding protein